jgi:hypothetical protein
MYSAISIRYQKQAFLDSKKVVLGHRRKSIHLTALTISQKQNAPRYPPSAFAFTACALQRAPTACTPLQSERWLHSNVSEVVQSKLNQPHRNVNIPIISVPRAVYNVTSLTQLCQCHTPALEYGKETPRRNIASKPGRLVPGSHAAWGFTISAIKLRPQQKSFLLQAIGPSGPNPTSLRSGAVSHPVPRIGVSPKLTAVKAV